MVIGLRLGDGTIKSKRFQLTKISRKHSTAAAAAAAAKSLQSRSLPPATRKTRLPHHPFFHLFSSVSGPKSVLFVNFRKEDLDLGPWKALFFFHY